jgi:hypothetical protein
MRAAHLGGSILIKSINLFAAQVDFADTDELELFIEESQVAFVVAVCLLHVQSAGS